MGGRKKKEGGPTAEEIEFLKMWLMQFHQYISERRAGMILHGDFPKLLQLYDESKPVYQLLRGEITSIKPKVMVDVNVKPGKQATAEALLLIADQIVECDLELNVSKS